MWYISTGSHNVATATNCGTLPRRNGTSRKYVLAIGKDAAKEKVKTSQMHFTFFGNDLKCLVSNRIRPHLWGGRCTVHSASAFKTRLPRRLQICYIKCSAVGKRCRFLWENIWPLWRTWTNIIQGKFGSLFCAPLEDENISSKQAPQQER